jgi:5-dehydro-2-deoxygluconokinase
MNLAIDCTRRLAAIIVGRAGMDLYPVPDGIETESAGHFAAEVGGSAANIAVAITRQDHPAALLGALSDDAVGRFVRIHLQRYGVDTSHCRTITGAFRTSLAICETRADDSETVFYRNGAVDLQLRAGDFDAQFIGSATFLVVTGTALAAEPSRSAALQALALARAAGTFAILDVDYRPVSWISTNETTEVLAAATPLCDAVVANDEEFAILTGAEGRALAAAATLVGSHSRFVVLKRGSAGSVTITADGRFETGIVGVNAKKPFGSGDAFLGNLVVALRRGLALEAAIPRASAAAAYVVARRGCAFAMPTVSELDRFIQGHSLN